MRMKKAAALILALMMLVGMLPQVHRAEAAEGPVIKLHYNRPDGNYSEWDVWMWEYGKDGAAYAFSNEGGDMVATMQVTPGVTTVGFIVRTASWAKDINEDQFIDIAEVVSGTVHIYVESGVKGYTKSYGEDAAVGIKVKTAKYSMSGSVEVTMTADIGEDINGIFEIKDSAGNVIDIAGFEKKDATVYSLVLAEELDVYGGNYMIGYDGNDYAVTLPIVYSTEEFEAAYTYTGNDLGATWSKASTAFRVWAPTAASVKVNLYEEGTAEVDDLIESVEMTKDVNGTWTATVKGDLNGTYYTYSAFVEGEWQEACDPYARTTGVNGARAMVIDLDSTDPEGWENDSNPHAGEKITDAVIYEGHIRDLTVNSDGNIAKRGKYLGLAETGTKTSMGSATGLDHLVELGITHLHIMPMYDFGSVDETSAINKYNWGYDPVNFNVPEGSYATDAYNGEVRVSEVKQMVQALHNNGISVVMDVVYNHVYSAKDFCVNRLVPGYFSRVTDGVYSNGSGCGNDTATERSMVRKYIVDSINYWVEEYHIDGFRFDLVGLIDTETVNEIVESVHEKHPDVIFYGEGWTLTTLTTKEDVKLATQTNSELTPDFAYFNDTVRDAIKGSVFNKAAGFVSGASGYESKIQRCFLGADTWCGSPSQTINYASCHDNNTLYDRIRLSLPDATEEEVISMNKLAAAIYMTSEGVPFMSAGEELLRSKQNKDGSYNDNSYNAGDTINTIKWANLDNPVYADVYEYYKGLIAFRKAHPALRLATAEEVEQYVSVIAEVNNHAVGFYVKGGQENESAKEMYLFFNAQEEALTYTLPEGEWSVFVNSEKAGTEVLATVSGTVTVEPLSALIVAKTEVIKTVDEDKSEDETQVTDVNTENGDAAGSNLSDTQSHLLIGGIGIVAITAVMGLAVRDRKKKKAKL